MLCKLLAMEGKCRLTTTEQQCAARQMKEELCYVAQDPSTERFGPENEPKTIKNHPKTMNKP